MKKWFTQLLLALMFLPLSQNLLACGFNFVGDCPNSIFFNINNTPDSFYVGHCTFGTHYEALQLGNLQSLQLTKIKGTTWESCQNNVTAMSFFYRIYPTAGNPTGAFLEVAMPETYYTLEGPYTTRYRIKPLNVNLLNGLVVGTNYTMEVYFVAKVDTVGDDFIPEIDWLNDNAGKRYHLTFTPGGATAPPFTVVTTKDVDVKCADDKTGIAGVNVYGNQTNLFYTWSNGSGNFFQSFNLREGKYTVTVSGAGGYSQTKTIEISAESHLKNSITNVQPVRCDGTFGMATAEASGGVQPIHFQWNSGSQQATATFSKKGIWWLTVTDAIGCTLEDFVQIEEQQPEKQHVAVSLCNGLPYQFGGFIFLPPGNFMVNLPALGGGCDTLVELELKMRDVHFSVEPTNATTANTANGKVVVKNLDGCTNDCQFKWSNGATSQNLSNLLPATYCLTVTNSAGCTSTACTEVEATVGTSDFFEKNKPLLVFPNPTSERLTVELPEQLSDEFFVKILDSRGAEVFVQSFENQKLRLDLSLENLPVGVFQILVFDSKKGMVGRFVKI